MRGAKFLLVLILVIALLTETDGWYRLRRRRRRRTSPRPATCKSRCRGIGKRSVDEMFIQEYINRPSYLEKYADAQLQTSLSSPSKSRQKRAGKLKYPGDCNSRTLRRFAENCHLCVTPGGKHWKVCQGSRQVTIIPHRVKVNNTCRSIINILNGHCT